MKGYGDRLRELRKKLDLSQDELGAKMGLSKSVLGKYEREEYFPTGKMLDYLASKYNVSIDYLLCNRGELFYEKNFNVEFETAFKKDQDIKEMLSLMNRMPFIRHSVMSYFHRLKIENREIIEK